MPSLPNFPGSGLVTSTTKRARFLAVGAVATGTFLVRKALRHSGDQPVEADPIAQTPTAPPGAEKKPVPAAEPKAKPDKPKAKPPKVKAEPAKKAKPKAPAPKPAKAKAGKAKAKPAKPKKAAPKPPKSEPGNISADRDHPHRALNNPIGDPDETEYPDPFEKRSDPRDPADPDGKPFGEEPHPQTGSESTSEPPLSQDPEVIDGGKPPKRENLGD